MSSRAHSTLSNASQDVHETVRQRFSKFVVGSSKRAFGKSVGDKIGIDKLLYDTSSHTAIVECKIVVEDDMVDQCRTLHTGCIAYLLDMITALPFVLLSSVPDVPTSSKFTMASFAPSKSLDITYTNVNVPINTKLKITASTITHVENSLYVRGEIREENNRLVAYANHVKMMPRKPPLAALRLGFKL